jgi:hypothetical protein
MYYLVVNFNLLYRNTPNTNRSIVSYEYLPTYVHLDVKKPNLDTTNRVARLGDFLAQILWLLFSKLKVLLYLILVINRVGFVLGDCFKNSSGHLTTNSLRGVEDICIWCLHV